MHFDIIFLDTTANKYYDRTTLEKEPLGGTEASVVRIAEGLGSLGLKVAVIQSKVNYFEPTMGQYCFFLHSDSTPNITCKHYIQIRRNSNPDVFQGAKKYIWLHDVACSDENQWLPKLKEHNITLIGVSRWHKKNIQEFIPNYTNITYIYNPVQEDIYVDTQATIKYDPNILVWMSSPHKGLGKALELFKRIRKENPKMQFIIFNPGYMQIDTAKLAVEPGLSIYGPMNCHSMWNVVQKSLCVFYPAQWVETFGLIAAEANALGTPVATYSKGAIKEILNSDIQMVSDNDEDAIISKVLDWSKNGRPKVLGRDEFRLPDVVLEWVKLLAK